MELENLRKIREIRNRGELLHIEIRYQNELGSLETKCGFFDDLRELPEDMSEVPPEYKDNYPLGFPFVSIAYKLDRNWVPVETKMYRPEDIISIRLLKPVSLP